MCSASLEGRGDMQSGLSTLHFTTARGTNVSLPSAVLRFYLNGQLIGLESNFSSCLSKPAEGGAWMETLLPWELGAEYDDVGPTGIGSHLPGLRSDPINKTLDNGRVQ